MFPGRCFTLYSNWSRHNAILSIRAGGFDFVLLRISWMARLSVTNMNGRQKKYNLNLSQPQTASRASFSHWLYRRSTSVSNRDAKHTLRRLFGSAASNCPRTAPRLIGLASTTTSVSIDLSKYAMQSVDIEDFNWSNAACSVSPHCHCWLPRVRRHKVASRWSSWCPLWTACWFWQF